MLLAEARESASNAHGWKACDSVKKDLLVLVLKISSPHICRLDAWTTLHSHPISYRQRHRAHCLKLTALPCPLLDWKSYINACPPLMPKCSGCTQLILKMIDCVWPCICILGRDECLELPFFAKSINLFIVIYWTGRLGLGFIVR